MIKKPRLKVQEQVEIPTVDDLYREIERAKIEFDIDEPLIVTKPSGYKRMGLQHTRFKWYEYEVNINIANLYFPKDYYTKNKLYSRGDGAIYLRFIGVREAYRSAIAVFIPNPYSMEYNDVTVILGGLQVKEFDFGPLSYTPYDVYNRVMECRSRYEGYLFMDSYMLLYLSKIHIWLMIDLDDDTIIVVCIEFTSRDCLMAVYIYVINISDTSINNALL